MTPGSLVPDEDQGFYISAVILPDGATLERTDKVVDAGRRRRSARTRTTRTSSRSPASTSSAAASATTRRRSSSRRSTGTSARSRRRSSSASCSRKTGRHQGSAGARVQSAADLRPRHGGRLRVLHPEPRRRRREAAGRGDAAVPRARQPGSAARRRADAVARDGAAALRRRRPREGEDARHPDLRRIRRAVGDARQLLRQRLQQVRPRVAGADVGRAGVPQSTRRHRRASTCARPRAR